MNVVSIRIAVFTTAFAWAIAAAAAAPGIIPAPARYEAVAGNFQVSKETQILWRGEDAEAPAKFLRTGLMERGASGLKLGRTADAAPAGAIWLDADAAVSTRTGEGYELVITPERITVRARAGTGLFYGVQSLLQLWAAGRGAADGSIALPAMRVEDQPRFAWRGLMLDESRHFFGGKTVCELLDMMAYLKLNRLHWHLTDTPGWRVEIKKYPKLTRVGGQGNWSNPAAPAAYYTQEDVRRIVDYARERHIMIIPEIDMPGHATAATRAYPELSGGGEDEWRGFTFNPAKEETYRALEEILGEVASLFPAPYLHLGGDEVGFGNKSWNTDPEIVRFARQRGITNAVELEHYFVERVAEIIGRLGKMPLGWDEVTGAGLDPQKTGVMWWRHDKPQVLKKALEANYQVVLCPRRPCYFDFVQHNSHQHGRRWNGFNDLASVYNFPETMTGGWIPAGKESRVMGIEACVWTERIQNSGRLEFMIYPRLAALAEAGWTPAAAKNQDEFMARTPGFLRELDRRNIRYFNPLSPASTPEPAGPAKAATGLANG